jgi:hypothetical protein
MSRIGNVDDCVVTGLARVKRPAKVQVTRRANFMAKVLG